MIFATWSLINTLKGSFKESHEILRKHWEITAVTGHYDFHKHRTSVKVYFFSQYSIQVCQ